MKMEYFTLWNFGEFQCHFTLWYRWKWHDMPIYGICRIGMTFRFMILMEMKRHYEFTMELKYFIAFHFIKSQGSEWTFHFMILVEMIWQFTLQYKGNGVAFHDVELLETERNFTLLLLDNRMNISFHEKVPQHAE